MQNSSSFLSIKGAHYKETQVCELDDWVFGIITAFFGNFSHAKSCLFQTAPWPLPSLLLTNAVIANLTSPPSYKIS